MESQYPREPHAPNGEMNRRMDEVRIARDLFPAFLAMCYEDVLADSGAAGLGELEPADHKEAARQASFLSLDAATTFRRLADRHIDSAFSYESDDKADPTDDPGDAHEAGV